ncbi:MAG: hypothetical protein ACYTGB_17435 [Planctomycetota bacterium]|jgi:hypothetical protein
MHDIEIFPQLASAVSPIITILAALGIGGTLIGVTEFTRRALKLRKERSLAAELRHARELADEYLAEHMPAIVRAHEYLNDPKREARATRTQKDIARRKKRKAAKASRKANR